jgi:3-isopropylmalate/(R)-2-methylmalate dehydratase large subunit
MGQATLVEKVIARAAGVASVRPGDIVVAQVDFAFAHDSSGPRRWKPILEQLGRGLWDPSRVAIVSDHFSPAADAESAAILKLTRDFARQYEVGNFFDMIGICHLVLPQHGLIRPGAFIAGGDSHTPMAGAFGAYAAGFGATDMAAIVATGETWLSVPETVRVEWSGQLGHGVTAKDMMLMLCRELGLDNAFKAIEFAGETGVVAPDAETFAYLAASGRPIEDEEQALSYRSDDAAEYGAVHRFQAGSLSPQIAAPHSPGNTRDAGQFGDIRIDQAYIGACVGAKIEDLRMAADILRGRHVAPGVRLLVAPASSKTLAAATQDGTLATLSAAGAIVLSSGCGACAGYGAGILAEGEVCISTTNRNFRGRMGDSHAEVYLGSPYSVAAAALTGRIVDPRDLLSGSAA